ncbi:MAG TPA: triose-phosphate isomerase [Candidatus Polarisedimenticolaceae bacterium]|nr:triose-phosphate isomerase [Candidatus Polarisedimenticolaceae bacterium]
MKHFTIVGNWKMHQTPEQAVRLVARLQEKAKPRTHVTSVLCPPFVSIPAVKAEIQDDLFKLGAQNLNEKDEGAFTGEVSGAMLKELADYVIVGHSERRHYEHETDKRIAKKVAAALRNGLTPILCVGEKLSDKQDGHTRRVVVDQLQGGLSQITGAEIGKVIVAYEPVWAIGTGESAAPDQVEPVVNVIRQTIEEMFGEAASGSLEILYGGSVSPDNVKAYLVIEHINGLLVGGASLNFEQFTAIMDTAASISDGR